MYQLILHIEYLLLRHDCVVVPGLGAFINVYNSARFDRGRQAWLPMNREVRFNGALTHDDGLLANSFSRKNGVGFAAGRELLRHSVAHLLETLKEDREVTMGQLGTLFLDEDAIVFRPMRDAAYISKVIGYEAAPLASTQKMIAKVGNEGSHDSKETKGKSQTETQQDGTNRGFDTSRNYYIPVNKMFARAAACIAVIFALAVAIMMPSTGSEKIDKASVLPIENIIENVKEKPVGGAIAETLSEAKVEEAVACYHAIVATFATESEAKKFVEQHANSGYELTIVNGRTKSRVSALHGENRAKVQEEISKTTFRNEFAEAWILEE